jgi:hypothetical protein
MAHHKSDTEAQGAGRNDDQTAAYGLCTGVRKHCDAWRMAHRKNDTEAQGAGRNDDQTAAYGLCTGGNIAMPGNGTP